MFAFVVVRSGKPQKESSGQPGTNVSKTTSEADRLKMSKMTKEEKAAYEKSLQKESKGGGG